MGFIAQYLMVDNEALKALADLSNSEFSETFFRIEGSETFERMDIDQLWDVLHYFLTGVSASNPIENNKLSEAIVGAHFFDSFDEESDFITFIENKELPEIITALETFDFEPAAEAFDPKAIKDLYPDHIWKDNKEQLLDEMKASISTLIDFYKKALQAGHHVIISIL